MTWTRYLEAGREAEEGVALLDRDRSSGFAMLNCDLLAGDGEGVEAGKGVDTPSALAIFASLCGDSGERGGRWSALRGTTADGFGRLGRAGEVKWDTK